MKSIRTNPRNGGHEGDERIRTAVCAPSTDSVYDPRADRGPCPKVGKRDGCGCRHCQGICFCEREASA